MWLHGLKCMSPIKANKTHTFVFLKVSKHNRKKTKGKLYTEKKSNVFQTC